MHTTGAPVTVAPGHDGFVHAGLCCRSSAQMAAEVLPFVAGGLEAGEPVFVNLAPAGAQVLRSALGADAALVRWSDALAWETHPARRLRAIQDLAAAGSTRRGARLRFVGECAWPEGPPELVTEWERFDAVLNYALAGLPLTMICVYDAGLPGPLVDHVAATHPLMGVDATPSDAYVAPEAWLAAHPAGPMAVPESATVSDGGVSPAAARGLVRAALGDALGRRALDDLVVAVTEAVSNAWRIGSSTVTVSCWATEREALVQVDDDGPGIGDPLAGYRRPPVGAESGRGLWIMRQVTDLVHIGGGPTGTSLQLRVFRHPPAFLRR